MGRAGLTCRLLKRRLQPSHPWLVIRWPPFYNVSVTDTQGGSECLSAVLQPPQAKYLSEGSCVARRNASGLDDGVAWATSAETQRHSLAVFTTARRDAVEDDEAVLYTGEPPTRANKPLWVAWVRRRKGGRTATYDAVQPPPRKALGMQRAGLLTDCRKLVGYYTGPAYIRCWRKSRGEKGEAAM